LKALHSCELEISPQIKYFDIGTLHINQAILMQTTNNAKFISNSLNYLNVIFPL